MDKNMSIHLIKALDEIREMPHITLGKVVEHVEGEALLIVCLIAILPFMQPIPIPGLSSVLGLIVFFQGLGLMFMGKPFLTKKLKELTITHEKFEMIYKAAVKFSNVTDKVSAFKHPLTKHRFSLFVAGLCISFSAAFLSLPLPIPFSNFIPALSIFLICIGLLEEDIVIMLLGYCITIAVIWMMMLSYGLIKEQLLSFFQ